MARPQVSPTLSHDEIRFLRELKVLADHNGAKPEETAKLEGLFEHACAERGLDPATIALTVEALC